jgi:hypothetical protein
MPALFIAKNRKLKLIIKVFMVKLSVKKLTSEDFIDEKIKNSHKDHCKPLTDTKKLPMDNNAKMKKRIV